MNIITTLSVQVELKTTTEVKLNPLVQELFDDQIRIAVLGALETQVVAFGTNLQEAGVGVIINKINARVTK